ncbi:MAG: DUF2490 domain-containing protein [Chitinophagaceae bacterium]|nr:DUF2490 domain-containing protein [Chitinophagaceae bacterium]
MFVTKSISKKTDWLIEYQWRRTNGWKDWQQGLFRTAIQYKPTQQLSLAAGYAHAETFPYGDFPIASNGRFPEHRLFEQVIVKQAVKKLSITSRIRAEQRWLARIRAGSDREVEDWLFAHRFRYLCRIQYPFLEKKQLQLYGAAADELFIGAGKNVGVNIFDQNRVFLLLGCRLNKSVSVELGYFNQVLQQGRKVNNNTIMQRNNGFVLASQLTF